MNASPALPALPLQPLQMRKSTQQQVFCVGSENVSLTFSLPVLCALPYAAVPLLQHEDATTLNRWGITARMVCLHLGLDEVYLTLTSFC